VSRDQLVDMPMIELLKLQLAIESFSMGQHENQLCDG